MILPKSDFWKDLLKEFCDFHKLGSAPLFTTLYNWEEFTDMTSSTTAPSSYIPILDAIILSPKIYQLPWACLHELCHHFQATREGKDYPHKYLEFRNIYGYIDNPYEIEARGFTVRWKPSFMKLYEEKTKR